MYSILIKQYLMGILNLIFILIYQLKGFSQFCVKYKKCRGKNLSYLIQLSRKKEFDDKKENHPKGWLPYN